MKTYDDSWERAWERIQEPAPDCPICGGYSLVISTRKMVGHGESMRSAYVKCQECGIKLDDDYNGDHHDPDINDLLEQVCQRWMDLRKLKEGK